MSAPVNVTLTSAQVGEIVQALYARLSETRHYLRGYERDSVLPDHDDCCPKHQGWIARRITERDALRQREEDVLSALHVLEPDTAEETA